MILNLLFISLGDALLRPAEILTSSVAKHENLAKTGIYSITNFITDVLATGFFERGSLLKLVYRLQNLTVIKCY